MINSNLLPFNPPGHEEGAERESRTGKKKNGEAVLIDKKHAERGRNSHSQTGRQQEVAKCTCSIYEWNHINNRCNGCCIYARQCDSLKKSDYQKRPEWAKYDGGKEGDGGQKSANHYNTFF